jgi:hypothetical protein
MRAIVLIFVLCALLVDGIPIEPNKDKPSSTDIEARTDYLLFNTSLPKFIKARDAALAKPVTASYIEQQLEWSSDGCSDAPDFDFVKACRRHDFGYRNYKKQGRWDEEHRAKLDDNFLNDMMDMCDVQDSLTRVGFRKHACCTAARVYWHAVREFGDDVRMLKREYSAQMLSLAIIGNDSKTSKTSRDMVDSWY